MTKTLTDGAKIHLWVEVGGGSFMPESHRGVLLWEKEGVCIGTLKDYNPNSRLKYLRGLYKVMNDKFNHTVSTDEIINDTEGYLEDVLEVSGYTGKVWND